MKNIINANKFRLIFFEKTVFFKYYGRFILNNNIKVFKFIIYLKILIDNIFLNNILK